MGVINKGHTFVSGENVTADKLNNLADDATFNSDTTDNTTLEVHSGGYLKVKDAGIDTQHLADDAVTYAKMQNVAANSVIGNPTGASATPQAISIADLSTDVVASISDATASSAGLMSTADKTKLDGIATGATANTGTVTSVTGSGGISGTVTTSGSLSLSNSGVTAGTYTNANVTVDATGRVTSASSGSSLSTYNSGYFFDPFFTTGNGGLIPSSTYNFAHGFSHTNFIVIVYVARTNTGLSETVLGDGGAFIEVDSTNIKVKLSAGPYGPNNRNFATGNNTGFPNWAWLRVLAISL